MALRDVKKNLKKKTEEAKRLAEQKNPTSYKGVRNVKRDAAHVAQTANKAKGNKQPSKATGTKQQKVTYYSNKAKTAAKNTGSTVRKATREATKSSGIKSLKKSTDKAIGKVAPKMSAGLDKKIENTKQRNELMRITRRTQALKDYDRYMDEKYGVKTPWPSYMSRKTPTDDEAKRLRENTEAWKSFDQWQKIAARNGDQKTVQLYEKYKKDLMADNDYINAKYANVTKRDYSFQNKTPLDVLKAEGWTNLWTGKTFPEIAKELRDTLPEDERNKAALNNAVTRIKYKTRNAGARQQALSEYDKGQNDEVRFQLGLAKQDYDRAQRKGDQAGMTAAHQRAEDIRMRYGGYSGGMTGDEYISPDVPDDIKKQLNDKGIVEWKKAQVQRNRAVTEDEIARADSRKQQILDDPNLRKYNRVKEALKYDALSIGSSAVGLAETTNAMMNEDFEKDVQKRWGDVNLQTLSARRQNAIAELEDYDRNIQTLGYDPKDRNRVVLQNELLSIEAAIDRKLNPNKYRELASVSPDSLSQRMYKSAQAHRENATRGLGTVGRYATEAGMMVGEVLPAMALAPLSGGTSLMAIGAQAAGARMNELNARGISPSESFSRGGLAGISAAATEKIPLERLGKLLKGQTGRNIVLSVLGNIGVEIGTEEADEIANTMMDFAYRDPEAEWSWDNIRDTAILTAISAGFMNVPAATVGQIVNGTAVRPRPSVRGEPRRVVSNPTDVDNTTQLQTPEIQAKTEEQANLITQAQDVQTDQRIEEARQLKTDVESYNALAKAGAYSPEEKAQVKAMLDERFAEIAGQETRRVEQAPPATLEEAAMQAVSPDVFQTSENITMPEARVEAPSPIQYAEREPVQYTAKEPVQRPPVQNVVQEEPKQRTFLNPQTEREVLSRNIKTFGENGQKAIMAAYQPGGDVMAYRQAFADVYDKALSGKDNIAKPSSLTQPQYYAAVQAGFNDRTISMGQTMFSVGRNKNAGIVRDEFTRNLDKDTYRMFDGLGKAAGAKIVFVDASQLDNPAADGQINGNVIMVKKNAVNPIAFVAGHELTHRIQDTGVKEYRAFRDYVISEIAKPGAVDAKIAEYAKHGARLTREKAMDEIAADYAGALFYGSEELQKFIRDNYANKTLLQTVLDAIRKIAEVLTGKERGSADDAVRLLEDALSAAAERTGRMKKVGDVTSRDNRAGLAGEGDAIDPPGRMSISSLGDALGFEARRYADGHVEFYRNGKQIKKVTAADVKKSRMGQLITIASQNGYISESDVTKQTRYLARLTNMILETKDAQMVYEFIGSMSWSAVKDNSDKQYGMTIDFEAICKKTEAMVAAMSEAMMRKGRGLSLDEIDVLYSKVVDAGETVPCPPCYVFSRWIGLGGLLDNINSFQKEFPDTSDGTERAERRIDEIREILADEITALQAQDKERVRLNEEAVARGEKKGKKDLTLKTLDEITNAAKKKRLEELNKQENKLITKRNKALSKLQFDKLSDSEKAKIEKELDKLNNQYTELTRQIRIMRMYSWLKDVRLSQTYKEVPNDVLFDLRAGERFADQYADTWAFRTGQGAYYGKAITPYTDARLGEIIQGVHKSANDIKIGDDNPFNGAFDATALTNKQRDELNAAYTAVKRQNLRGGVRMQSVSDFRYEYGLDYIQTFFELQAIGAAIQTYTKVVEFVDMAASTGAFVNMSLIPWGNGFKDGKLAYSSATGMDAEAAFKLQKQWNTAGTILIGVSDEHIRAAMADKNIYFIIPYHKSGGRDDVIRGMLSALGERIEKYEDYTYVQSEKFPSSANPVLTLRNKILTANKYFELNSKEQALVEGNEILRSLYNRKFFAEDDPLYGVQLLSEDCKHIYPYEYWDTTSTYKTADINGKRYLDWCEALDVKPKFSGDADGNHDFRNDKGYWKLLIDRRMYGRNGKYNPLVHINVSGLGLNQLDRERAKERFGEAMTAPADLRKTQSIVDAAFPETVAEDYTTEGRFSVPSDKDYKGLSKAQMKAQLKRDAGEKLTEAEFNRLYSIHKLDYRGQWAKKGLSIDDQIDAIAENGFKGGSGAINLLPASTYNVTKYQGVQTYNEYKKWEAKGELPEGTADRYREKLGDTYGQPEFGSVVQREFAPKKGDTLLLVPEGYRENDMVAQGYKPFPYEILRITEDYQRPYSLYEKEYQDSRYSIPSDSEYLDAYFDGDDDRMQEMVDKAAYDAGYKYKAYHHTENAFTVFDINKARRGMDIQGFFFSADPEAEREYGSARYDVYLKMEKPFVVDSVEKMNAIPIKYGTYDYGVKAREWLQEQGYDSVIRDAEFFGAEADEYIVFESEQIKSSDPVVYDDDDNVIPLSERFNAENEDIRYSIGTEGFDQAQLMRENQQLRDKLAYWKSQTKRSDRTKSDPKAVKRLAKKLAADFSTDMDVNEIAGQLQAIYDGLGKDWAYDQAYNSAMDLARNMVEQASAIDDYLYNEYDPMRQHFRKTEIVLSPSDRAGITDYNDWRKAQMGRMIIKHGEQSNVDQVYQELSQLWPEWFNEERDNTSLDQLDRIVEVLDSIYSREAQNPFEGDVDGPAEYLAAQIMDSFWDMPNIKKTFADRAEARLGREVAKRLDMKAKYEEKLQQVREDRNKKLKQKSEEYLGKRRAATQRQKERERRAQIIRHARDLWQKLNKGTDTKHIPYDLTQVVSQMLASINLGSGFDIDPVTGKRVEKGQGIETKKTQAFEALRTKLIQAKKEGEPLVLDERLFGDSAEGIRGNLDALIAMANIPIANMNMEQLEIVWQTIRAVEHAITTYGKVLANEKYRNTDQWVNAIEREAETRRSMKSIGLVLDILIPYSFYSQFGESGIDVYKTLRNAQDIEERRVDELADRVEKIVTPKQVKEWKRQRHTFQVDQDTTLTLTTDQIMDIYNLAKRPQALNHLLGAGIVQPEIKTGGKKIKRGTDAIQISPDLLSEMVDTLTPEQQKVADDLQKLTVGMLAEWGNEASMKAYGYQKFNEPNYWSIRTAAEGIHSSIENNRNNPRSIKNIGLAKTTVPNANNALDVMGCFDNFGRHAMEMITYSTWLNPMEDVNRIFNWQFRDSDGNKTGKTMKGIINRVAGQGGQKYWMNLMTDIQNGISSGQDTTVGGYINKLIANSKAAAVGANIRVVIQQPTAIMRALAVMNPVDLMQTGNPIKGWNEAKKWAGIAARKERGGFDIAAPARSDQTFFGQRTPLEALGDASGWLAGKADAVTWGMLWNAAKSQVNRQNKDLAKGSDEYYQKVADVFSNVINQTQVVDGVLQRSQIMRSEHDIMKMATSFMGEPIMSMNMLIRTYNNLRYQQDPQKRTEARKAFGKAAVAFAATCVVNALAQAVVDAIRDDDPDREYLESLMAAFIGADFEDVKMMAQSIVDGIKDNESDTMLLKRIGMAYNEMSGKNMRDTVKDIVLNGNVMENLNPMNSIPFVSDIASMFQGYDVTRMDADVMADVIKKGKYWIQAMNGEGKNTKWYATVQLAAQIGKLFGIPGHTVIRDITGSMRLYAKKTDNLPLQYAIEKAIYSNTSDKNKSFFKDMAWKALKEGDTGTFDQIRSDLINGGVFDGKSFDDAMKKLAKDNPDVSLPQNLKDILGIRTQYAQNEDEDEDEKFSASDLTGDQYEAYSKQRANRYRADETEAMKIPGFDQMDDESKDKVLKLLWDYEDNYALKLYSNGQYDVTKKDLQSIHAAGEHQISPAQYAVAKVMVSKAEGTKDANGNTIKNSAGIAERIALDNTGINFTDEQREYMAGSLDINSTAMAYTADQLASEQTAIQEKANAPSKLDQFGTEHHDAMEHYYATVETLHADKDANGKTIQGSKKKKVVAEIANIPGLTNAQRRDLYLEQNYSEKDCPF